MSDRPLQLLLVDQDPIFRLGLRVALEAIPNLQVVSEAQTDTAALQILAQLAQINPNQVDLVILELGNSRSIDSQQQGLQLCQQLKATYPTLPILLLSSISEAGILMAAKAAGVQGYCPKGTPVAELVTAIEAVAVGNSYWLTERVNRENPSIVTPAPRLPLAQWRQNLRLSGMSYIDAALLEVTAQLQIPGLPILERAVLAGRRRELLASRWLVNQLLTLPQEKQQPSTPTVSQPQPIIPPPTPSLTISNSQRTSTSSPLLSPRALQANLFASCINKLQFPLQNVSPAVLEIDILREDKKRELLYLILQKLAQQLDALRNAQITINQLSDLAPVILYDLWQAVITDFFGKFSRVQVGNRSLEIVTVLLQNPGVVQTAILNKIPLVSELLSYLLFQTNLIVEHTSYPAGSSEANFHAEMLLENLLIQLANSVIQPLLNYLADVEEIKQDFYIKTLMSTRELERFRNDLSWKYRLNNYVNEAKAIFESRYELLVFAPRGIAQISIYAPRNAELAQLSGVPLAVTLGLEFRDAIAPRLQSLLSIVGSGIVFVLTQIVGRGLGLIGRGILQGIGSVSLDKNFKRNKGKGER
ncbi:response regulator receiver domain protein [Nostoc sp. NIES-2111]|nr:response regulator receiver domain protein [Nostoc sp. NIES-2111]